MKEDELLIVFAKNLVYGKVKTRLAATLGNEQAFRIYEDLLAYTCSVTRLLECHKTISYSDFREQTGLWNGFTPSVQHGNDIGERMMNAFRDGLSQGFQKVVIIGTDCFEITTSIIENAFAELDKNDVVIGPAADGGYYLIGLKKVYPPLFTNIAWSTDTVFTSSIAACKDLGLGCSILELLHDVDEEKDIRYIL